MASEILGLFTTPQQYQQNQLAQFQNRAAQEVQLDPFQQAALGARTAGFQLGQGIGGALGGEDPQLKKITQRQQLLGMMNALELSKGLIKADGTVDETVYNQLLGYGKIGTDIIEQRLKATQGLESVQVQNLAKKLFDKDGKRNPEVEKELSTTVAGRAILKQFIPETKVFKRGDIITKVNPVTGDYEIVTPAGLKAVPAGANPIKAMIDTKAIDPTVTPFAQEIANQWDSLDDKGRSDALESLTKVK
jgi:hypothetical protein